MQKCVPFGADERNINRSKRPFGESKGTWKCRKGTRRDTKFATRDSLFEAMGDQRRKIGVKGT